MTLPTQKLSKLLVAEVIRVITLAHHSRQPNPATVTLKIGENTGSTTAPF